MDDGRPQCFLINRRKGSWILKIEKPVFADATIDDFSRCQSELPVASQDVYQRWQ